MRLNDVVNGAWAITPEMFEEVQGIYARHCRGEKIDLDVVEAKVGAPLKNTREPVQITDNGVAVIQIDGVLSKRMNLFSQISGGTSTQIIGSQFDAAMADDAVKAIVLAIDSPGGTVDGTQELADKIYNARGKKPVLAYSDGMVASAAYWIASAADAIYISGDTTTVGSIGVIATHTDVSMANAQKGVKVTEVKAGKFKGMGSSNAPLGAGESILQAQVDHIYGVFLGTVARNLGVDVSKVATDMAEGRVFLGRNAIDAGLVAGVATFSNVVAQATALAAANPQASNAGVAPMADSPKEIDMPITTEQVRAEAPAVAQAFIDEGRADSAKAVADARAEGAAAELARVTEIDALATPGCEQLIAGFKADGKTTPAQAAVKILGAVNAKRDAALAALRSDASAVQVASAEAPAGSGKADKAINTHDVSTRARALIDAAEARGETLDVLTAVDRVMAEAK